MGWREKLAQLTGRRPSVKPCPKDNGDLCVVVTRSDNPAAGVPNCDVVVTGPSPGSGKTDATGVVEFPGRTPGSYKYKVKLPAGSDKTWRLHTSEGSTAIGAGSVASEFVEASPVGTLVIRVFDDLSPRNRVRAATRASVAYLNAAEHTEHQAADLYLTVPAGKVTVNVSPFHADMYDGGAGQKSVDVPQGGTGIAEFILPVINVVTPKLEPQALELWFLRPDPPPPPPPAVAPNWPALPNVPPTVVRLGLQETRPEKPYTGDGTLSYDPSRLAVFRDAGCTQALASGVTLTNAELKAGLQVHVKGLERGAGALQLALAPSGNPLIPVAGPAHKILTVREENVVEPQIKLEYKVVLWDRGLAAHQKDDKGVVEKDLFKADATKVELQVQQRGADAPYTQSVHFEAPNCDIFMDEACTKKLDPAQPISVSVMSKAPYPLWLRGKTKGQFDAKLTMTAASGPHIHVRGPAVKRMGVVELQFELYQHDEAALVNETFEADKDTLDAYYAALKDKVIPDQKVMTDAQKVWPGRMLHESSDGSHGRAKLVLKARDASQWPPGTDDYTVHLNRVNTTGAVAVWDAETEGKDLPFPVPREGIKVSALSADKTYWIEGSTACDDWRGVKLDLTVDRPDPSPDCDLAAEPKRNADFARFTVVKIKSVKLDYKPETGKAVAWDDNKKRFYINLKAEPDGRKVKLDVELTAKLKDVPLHVMLAPHKDNGKVANWNVDLPVTWKWGDLDFDVKPDDRDAANKLLHKLKKTDADGKASVELKLSRFGGDVFEPAVYITQDPHLAKYVKEHPDDKLGKRKPTRADHTITVWRKIWVQRIDVEGVPGRDFAGAIGQYERVKVEMIVKDPLVLQKATVNAFDPQAVYPMYMVRVNGGNADALVVSDPNKGNFFDTFAIDADKPNTIPILVCDAQWDPKGETGPQSGNALASNFPLAIQYPDHPDYNVGILTPPLEAGDLFVEGTWKAADKGPVPVGGGPAPWVNVRSGDLTNDDISISPSRGALSEVSVRIPPGVGATNATTRIWIKDLKVLHAGIYLGESFQQRILAVYEPSDPGDFQNTIAHELGHAYHQVIEGDPAGGVAGVPEHPHQVDLGQGNHCRYNTNVCVMFDSGTPAGGGRLDNYCPKCQPYLLVQDMTTIV